jgi:hypothetical protein
MRLRALTGIVCAAVMTGSALAGAQEPPRALRAVPVTWDYGILETAQTGKGTAFVFCRFTPDGCAESVLGVKPLPAAGAASIPPGTRQGAYEAFAASAIAALGRDGWELVTETGFGSYGGPPRVLLFKRPAAR